MPHLKRKLNCSKSLTTASKQLNKQFASLGGMHRSGGGKGVCVNTHMVHAVILPDDFKFAFYA